MAHRHIQYPTVYEQYAAAPTPHPEASPILVLRPSDPKVIVLIAHPSSLQGLSRTDAVADRDSDRIWPDDVSQILARFSTLLAGSTLPVKELAHLCLEDDRRVGVVLQCRDDVRGVEGGWELESVVAELLGGGEERGVGSEDGVAGCVGQEVVGRIKAISPDLSSPDGTSSRFP